MRWLDNLYVIAETNSHGLSYRLGLNQFSDLNGKQFRQYVHGDNGACFKGEDRAMIANANGQDVGLIGHMGENPMVQPDAPDSVDWYM